MKIQNRVVFDSGVKCGFRYIKMVYLVGSIIAHESTSSTVQKVDIFAEVNQTSKLLTEKFK